MTELSLVDPAQNPYLSGRFAPVHTEIEARDLQVDGDLPADLVGTYLRNGPNPKFPPLGSYLYPMEGDGMVHGLWFEDGQVRYQNRWVTTASLAAEERAGRALFGGLTTPAFVDQSLLGPDPDPGWPSKLDAFINIVRHAGRYLALEEGMPCYEITPELQTVGRYEFGGGLAKGLCAHPKIDPRTGEMVVFRYDVEAPFLTWAVVAADGTMARPEEPIESVDRGYMVHDFVITERYLVVSLGPAVFDIEAMLAGGSMLAWKPELGMRIAVIRRDGSAPIRWIETDAYWVWHYANAHEVGDTIEMDFPWWSAPGFLTPGSPSRGSFVRAALSLERGTMALTTLHDGPSEFPRIDDRLTGQPYRYAVVGATSGDVDGLVPGEHDLLCRIDLHTGDWVSHPADGVVGEAVFAPRAGGTDELDGYYLAYVNDLDGPRTTLGIWEAADFPGPPRARVHLPQRVPNGLHGNWFPA